MAEYQSSKDKLKEITDSIETGIQNLFESDKYKQYLKTMSKFHHYSTNNVILISLQNPDATLVAGFQKWKKTFSRNVKKGEKAIKIIAPTPYIIKEEREKLDPATKNPIIGYNGKIETEEIEKEISMFRVVSVFDVSQTDGKEIPTLINTLTGDVAQYDTFMEAIKQTAPVPISFETMSNDIDGYFHLVDKRIAIRDNMSEVQTVSAAIHEMAHSLLHNLQKQAEVKKDRNTEEVEAESISYAVCNYYGIETSDNSFGYIANWSKGKDLKELKASLETINNTSSQIITGIDKHFNELVKHQAINKQNDNVAKFTDTVVSLKSNENPLKNVNLSKIVSTVKYSDIASEFVKSSRLFKDTEMPLYTNSDGEKFVFGFGNLGNATTVWNYLDKTNNDYTNIAHISDNGELKLLVENLPDTAKEVLEEKAKEICAKSDKEKSYYKPYLDITDIKREALGDYDFEEVNFLQIYLDEVVLKYDISETQVIDFVIEGITDKHFEALDLAKISKSDFAQAVVMDNKSVISDKIIENHSIDVKLSDIHSPLPDNYLTGDRISTPRGNFWLTYLTKEEMQDQGYGFHHNSNDDRYAIMSNGSRAFAVANENPLKNAEMSSEQNYNMIDGIVNNEPTVKDLEKDAKNGKPISVLQLLEATRREQKQKVQTSKSKSKNNIER
ncbi:MAG: DUF4316 domain-containing protein [Clostridia bacterium]